MKCDNPARILSTLTDLLGVNAILETDEEFIVKTTAEVQSARELNRQLLPALRLTDKRAILRAEWSHDGITERFFDYVLKGIRNA